jgi:hypothetical protein
MKPRFFRVECWDERVIATCTERRISSLHGIPWGFREPLPFMIYGEGGRWYDVIWTRIGILLFSQKVRDAFAEDEIGGMEFCEANIHTVNHLRLRKDPTPTYYWGRPMGLIDFDHEEYEKRRRYIVVRARQWEERTQMFQLNYRSGPGECACRGRALETLHRHRINNLRITPLDYFKPPLQDVFKPPFRIDVSAKKWPPPFWYPEDFVPHPSNLRKESPQEG